MSLMQREHPPKTLSFGLWRDGRHLHRLIVCISSSVPAERSSSMASWADGRISVVSRDLVGWNRGADEAASAYLEVFAAKLICLHLAYVYAVCAFDTSRTQRPPDLLGRHAAASFMPAQPLVKMRGGQSSFKISRDGYAVHRQAMPCSNKTSEGDLYPFCGLERKEHVQPSYCSFACMAGSI